MALVLLVPIQGFHSLQPLPRETSLSSHPSTKAVHNSEFIVVLASPDQRYRFESSAPVPFTSSLTIGNTFQAYLCKNVSESGLTALRSHLSVAYVEANAIVHTADIQLSPPNWGLKRVSKRELPMDDQFVYTDSAGIGQTVYVIDSGIYVDHEDFEGRAVFGVSYTNDGDEDCDGHGTHVAGIVGGKQYGVAKQVNLVAVKVLDCEGNGDMFAVAQGIAWSVEHKARMGLGTAVINLSLGGGYSQTLNDAVNAAYAEGMFVVAAAGNDFTDACTVSPASAAEAFTVAAADSIDNMAYFTNIGPCVQIWAPGVDINSAFIGSTSANLTESGTSQASPHVAGVAALFLAEAEHQNQQLKLTELADLITDLATPDLIEVLEEQIPELPYDIAAQFPWQFICTTDGDCPDNWHCCPGAGLCTMEISECCGSGGCIPGATCCAEACCSQGFLCSDGTCIIASDNRLLFDDTVNLNLFNNGDKWDYQS